MRVARLGALGVLVGSVLLGLVPGCGGDDETKPNGASHDDDPSDVLAACTSFAERLCGEAALRDCCEASEGAFDAAACVADFVDSACRIAADLVREGLATYDVSAEEPCLAAYASAHTTCFANWDELVGIRREVWSACKAIRGTTPQGRGCGASAACARPEGAARAACVHNVCTVIEILAEGAACPYPNGDVSTCDTGLYCTATGQGEVGVCELATPDGAACNPILQNPECGLGHYCDLDAAVCRTAVNLGGPSCSQGTECVSFLCDRLAETCEEAPTTAAGFCGNDG